MSESYVIAKQSTFKNIADAIRHKTNQPASARITAEDMPSAIANISNCAGDTLFWDALFRTETGATRYTWTWAFTQWTDANYIPPLDRVIIGGSSNGEPSDVAGQHLTSTFAYSRITDTKIPIMTNAICRGTFTNARNLKRIASLEEGQLRYSSKSNGNLDSVCSGIFVNGDTFVGTTSLEEITINGRFISTYVEPYRNRNPFNYLDNINFSYSYKLSEESLKSILQACIGGSFSTLYLHVNMESKITKNAELSRLMQMVINAGHYISFASH